MANDDLISRSALIERLAYYHSHSLGDAEYAYGTAVREVLNALTIDAVPVVRCRECKEYIYPAGVCKYWNRPVRWVLQLRREDGFGGGQINVY